MRFFLIGHDVWDIVTGDFSEPTDTNLADYSKHKAKWERNNARIMTWFSRSVDTPIKIELSRFDTAKDCWDHLKKFFCKSNYAREYQLEIDIRVAHQGDRTIQQFYHEMSSLWDQLDMIDSPELLALPLYAEKRKRQKLFQFIFALRDDFENIRSSILHRNPLPDLDNVVSELLADEDRLKSQFSRGATMQQPAVFAASKHSFSPFHQHKNRNHILPNECKYCHGIGHWAKDCPSLVKDPSGMPSRHHSQSTHSSLPPHMSQSHTQHSAHPHSQASSSSSDSVAAITSQLQQLLEKNGGVSNIGASAFSASEYPLLEADWDHP
ncbi:hypothetical protein ACHQM5_029416 [Ranunculus cassubicifolius]